VIVVAVESSYYVHILLLVVNQLVELSFNITVSIGPSNFDERDAVTGHSGLSVESHSGSGMAYLNSFMPHSNN
jgi:hypothetical protein